MQPTIKRPYLSYDIDQIKQSGLISESRWAELESELNRRTRNYSIVSVFDEVGSGMNDNRKKLQKLFELVERD